MVATATKRSAPGEICPDTLYRLDEIKSRLGLGTHAMREARKRGLQIRRCGKRAYVLGSDAIAYILTHDRAATA